MRLRTERRFLWRKGVGDQTGEKISEEIDRAPVPGMFNLAQVLGDVPAIAEELADDVAGELLHQREGPIIRIPWREHDGHQVALVGDDEVQLKAIEPAHRRFAALGKSPEVLWL